MTEGAILALAAVLGALVGFVYLALLWAGVRALSAGRSGAIYGLLLAARAGVVLGALGLAAMFGAHAMEILTGLAGFIAARLVGTRFVGGREGGSTWK